MGRKKKKQLKPWCWYCNREFDDEKVLIQHQKAKHFKCHICHKKLYTGPGLAIHCVQVHKETIDAVPNSVQGRTDVEIEIYGMEGIPDDDQRKHEAQKRGTTVDELEVPPSKQPTTSNTLFSLGRGLMGQSPAFSPQRPTLPVLPGFPGLTFPPTTLTLPPPPRFPIMSMSGILPAVITSAAMALPAGIMRPPFPSALPNRGITMASGVATISSAPKLIGSSQPPPPTISAPPQAPAPPPPPTPTLIPPTINKPLFPGAAPVTSDPILSKPAFPVSSESTNTGESSSSTMKKPGDGSSSKIMHPAEDLSLEEIRARLPMYISNIGGSSSSTQSNPGMLNMGPRGIMPFALPRMPPPPSAPGTLGRNAHFVGPGIRY